MDALFLIFRDHGKLGIEGMSYPEWTRADVVHLCAFDYRTRDRSDVVRILEIHMDAKPEDVTEEIMREADLLRVGFHQEAAE